MIKATAQTVFEKRGLGVAVHIETDGSPESILHECSMLTCSVIDSLTQYKSMAERKAYIEQYLLSFNSHVKERVRHD